MQIRTSNYSYLMNDFRVTLLTNHFEFLNLDTLLSILNTRSYIPSWDIHIHEFHCAVMVPQPHGRPAMRVPVVMRNLTVGLSTLRATDEPQLHFTIILTVGLVHPVAGTEELEIALYFKEDKTYLGYDLPNAFRGTALISLHVEFRVFDEYTLHRPTTRFITVN